MLIESKVCLGRVVIVGTQTVSLNLMAHASSNNKKDFIHMIQVNNSSFLLIIHSQQGRNIQGQGTMSAKILFVLMGNISMRRFNPNRLGGSDAPKEGHWFKQPIMLDQGTTGYLQSLDTISQRRNIEGNMGLRRKGRKEFNLLLDGEDL